jgi:hypothetical protein
MLQRRMAQLVQRPAPPVRVDARRRLLEQQLGAGVGQPAAAGGRIDVDGRGRTAPEGGGTPVGQEHRPGGLLP